jgi:hypothetical protein
MLWSEKMLESVGDKQAHGKTAGEVLAALTTPLPTEATGTLVIVQPASGSLLWRGLATAALHMRITPGEFRSRPLRVHAFLQDVPLQDVWAIQLRGGGAGRTIHDLRPLFTPAGLQAVHPVVQGLFRLRAGLGTLLGWDQQRPTWSAESYIHRLTPTDRAQSVVSPGTQEGLFSILYVFEHEQLSELRNATVHAFSSLSMAQVQGGYLAYWAIYVRPVSRFTALYMTAIAPFRRFLVYPALIRQVQRTWVARYGGEGRMS